MGICPPPSRSIDCLAFASNLAAQTDHDAKARAAAKLLALTCSADRPRASAHCAAGDESTRSRPRRLAHAENKARRRGALDIGPACFSARRGHRESSAFFSTLLATPDLRSTVFAAVEVARANARAVARTNAVARFGLRFIATLLGEPVTGVGAFSWRESEFTLFEREIAGIARVATVSAGRTGALHLLAFFTRRVPCRPLDRSAAGHRSPQHAMGQQ